MKTYIITDTGNKDAISHINKELEKYNIKDVEFFNRISSSNQTKIDMNEFQNKHNKPLTLNEASTTLTHIELYKKILSSNDDYVMILEDNVEFLDNLNKIKCINFSGFDFDIIFLNELINNSPWYKSPIIPNGDVTSNTEIPITFNKIHLFNHNFEQLHLWTNSSYLISKVGIEKILKFNEPIKYLIDEWHNFHLTNVYKSLTPFVKKSDNVFTTTEPTELYIPNNQHYEPLISIIIPVYNDEDFVGKSIDSALSQTYQNTEIVIVNDGSTDNSDKIISEYVKNNPKIKYIKQENKGLGAARNKAIENSNGTYILQLDSDDIISPDYVEKASKMTDSNTFVSVYANIIDENDNFTGTALRSYAPVDTKGLLNNCSIIGSTMYPKQMWKQAGGFDESLVRAEDWDMWVNFYSHGNKVTILHNNHSDYGYFLKYRKIKNKGLMETATDELNESMKNKIFDKYKEYL